MTALNPLFIDYVDGLTNPQLRAFACQHGFRGWATDKADNLRDELILSEEAENTWKEIYGEDV